MSYTVLEKKLTDLYQELRVLEKTIDQLPSSDQAAQRQIKKKLINIEKDSSLEAIAEKISAIDEQLQSTVVCDPSAFTLIKVKKSCQKIFTRIFGKYQEKISETSEKNAKTQGSSPIEQNEKRAELAIDEALNKIAVQKHAEKSRGGLVPRIKNLRPFAKDSSALYAFYRVCESLFNIPSHLQNEKSAAERMAQAFLQLPCSLRRELIALLKIEETVELEKSRKEIGRDSKRLQLADSLSFLGIEERSLLQTRLESSFNPEDLALARFVSAFEKGQQTLARTVAARGAGFLLKAMEILAKTTIEKSQVEHWDQLFPTLRQKKSMIEVAKGVEEELAQTIKKTSGQEIEAVLAAKPRKGEALALLTLLGQAQAECGIIFEQFYANVVSILHQSISESDKRQAVEQLIKKLPQKAQNVFFGKIYEVNPHRQPTKQWGEKHALDNWGVLLEAAFSFCLQQEKHPLQPLFKELQKVVHDHAFKSSDETQRAVGALLKKYKTTIPLESWNQFKGQFFNRFPGQEKWQWGLGGEEHQAHKYPYHMLLTLQAMISPSSQTEYWDRMKACVHARYEDDDSSKMPNLPLLEKRDVFWQQYNAIEGYRQARPLGKLRQHPFFPKMWQMSPLCRGVKSGEEQAIDKRTYAKIAYRLKWLALLDKAKNSIGNRYMIDQPVWNALIYRIILQETPLSKSDIAGFQTVIGAFKDLAKDPTYDPVAAKEILQLLIDMSSRRVIVGNIRQAMALKEVQRFAYSTALQAKSLDHVGPTMYKPLTFFKDETGKILGKLKPLDRAMGNNGNYKVEHFFREIASSQINDTFGFDITVPTAAFRLTLGEAIRILAERYTVEPQSADRLFASMHPLLREAVQSRLSYPWEKALPKQKGLVLQEFYMRTGTTDLLHLIVERLSGGTPVAEILPLFDWLPVNTRRAIYAALYAVMKPKGKISPDFGELAFHHQKKFSSSSAEKIQAIEAVKEYQQATGLQHGYAEEGLGTLQPWAQDVETIMGVLSALDGAEHIARLPKERVDLYSLLHILKSEGDSYPGNTLLSKSDQFIDCDEEHALQPYNHYDLQLMGELGWPQGNTPIRPLLLRLILHPYFQQTCQALPANLLTPKVGDKLLAPFRKKIQQQFKEPMQNFRIRAEKIQRMAKQGITRKKQHSVRDLFFAIYDVYEQGAKEQYQRFREDPRVRDRLATFFEIYLGEKAKFGAPACLQRWGDPKYQHYAKNIKDLSEMQLTDGM